MSGRRILALTTDSFGGRGGIANYARDAITSMAARDDVAEVVVLLAVRPDATAVLPAKVRLLDRSRSGRIAYVTEALRQALAGNFDAVWIAHAALAPLGWLAARRSGARLGMTLHGSEVWQRGRASREWAMSRADLLMPVSRVTMERYLAARGEHDRAFAILPGAVDVTIFTPGPKSPALLDRYGISGRKVLLTVSRIGLDWREKGFARLFRQLPKLVERWPDLVYVIAGDGSERGPVEAMIHASGLAKHVIITGYVAQSELADHYRMADAFILPSSGEGLGIVLLEAQACGIPAIASLLDGGREAVVGMGRAVDPEDADAVETALAWAFDQPRTRPHAIEAFAKKAFAERMNTAVDRLLA